MSRAFYVGPSENLQPAGLGRGGITYRFVRFEQVKLNRKTLAVGERHRAYRSRQLQRCCVLTKQKEEAHCSRDDQEMTRPLSGESRGPPKSLERLDSATWPVNYRLESFGDPGL